MVKHTFYDKDNAYIPDVELVKVVGDSKTRSVYFRWCGITQWLEMSTDNQYGDNFWLVVKTDYTPDFEDWLDENLGGYDSLETMFSTGLEDVIPETYSVEFEVAR